MPQKSTLFAPALAFALSLLGGFACSVTFSEDFLYSCEGDDDCGGDGFTCIERGSSKVCCKPTGDEICDGLDNDCDGLVDNRPVAEICNGEDDNCDGRIDETFNLATDPNNCGTCGNVCPVAHRCTAGACQKIQEVICYDGNDNDGDGKADCADDDCDGLSCGDNCVCRNLAPGEGHCYDAEDNDDDGKIDCADEDCVGASCKFAPGCECTLGAKKETNCSDGVDNDDDGKRDCEDEDCQGLVCTPGAGLFYTCSPISSCANPPCNSEALCQCNGTAGNPPLEYGGVFCTDEIDNDCNGLTDCQEPGCTGFGACQ